MEFGTQDSLLHNLGNNLNKNMKIDIQKMPKVSERTRTLETGGVVIASKLNKVKEFIDANGNVIDPVTKKIIKKNQE